MSNEKDKRGQQDGVSDTGSGSTKTDDLIQSGPNANDGGLGEPKEPSKDDNKGEQTINPEDYVPKKDYKEMESKMGEQGKELGDLRGFFKEVSPLLDKLQEQPQLVEAIMDGKIDSSLADAVLEGKVKVDDATKITEAHDEVKKDLGEKGYKNATKEEVEKLISDKVSETIKETEEKFTKNLKASEEKNKFEKSVEDFIAQTSDFSEHADDVYQWLEDHPSVYDIEVAYHAVKGQKAVDEQKKKQQEEAGEEAKKIAANAGGGASQGGQITGDKDDVDKLISDASDPNAL